MLPCIGYRLKAIGLVTKWKYECEEIFKAEMDRRLNSRNVRLPYLLLDIKAIMSEGATSLASLDSRCVHLGILDRPPILVDLVNAAAKGKSCLCWMQGFRHPGSHRGAG